MREILFRGIIKSDNSRYKRGQWAVGDLVRLQDGNDGKPHIYGCGEVFAETIGQYTDLTDKNGTKIFEGDIVTNHKGDIGRVTWYEEHSAFMIYSITENKVFRLFDNDFSLVEVIGNIYDDPELLGDAKRC